MVVGDSATFTATARDADGGAVPASFTWASTDTDVATVSGGVVTAVGHGTAGVTASAGGVASDEAVVTVVAEDQPSSYQLIDAALLRGDIDEETALAYKVFATFGDERLPHEYDGDDAGRDGTLLMSELSRRLAGLSIERQRELAPFLLPPPVPGSWYTPLESVATPQQVEWAHVTTQNDEVEVWYHPDHPGDADRAAKVAAEIDRLVWPKLTGLMREPLPDCGASCPEGGGDSRIDVYLVRVERAQVTGASDVGSASGFMLLHPLDSFDVLAHEFMHLIQFAYPMSSAEEYDWLFEAMWENATLASSHAAVNAAASGRGGLVEVWPRFALRNWNRDTVDDYSDWDQLTARAATTTSYAVGAPGRDELATDVPHLAAFYYHFTFTTERVRSVIVENPYGSGADQHAHVHAIAKIGGQWREPEDLTSVETTHSGYHAQGVLHFLSSTAGAGSPVPAPGQGDVSTIVLVVDPVECRYTMGARAYVEAVLTDVQGDTTDAVVPTGSFSTAWRPLPDDLHLVGEGGFAVHTSGYILDQDDLIDAFLLDDFYVKKALGEDGMGVASVSWSLAPEPPPPPP